MNMPTALIVTLTTLDANVQSHAEKLALNLSDIALALQEGAIVASRNITNAERQVADIRAVLMSIEQALAEVKITTE